MTFFINFLLESSILMGVFVTFFVLVLRRHANPTVNRIYLLISLSLVVSVPFLNFDLPHSEDVVEIEYVENTYASQSCNVHEPREAKPLDFVVSAAENYNEVVETSVEPSISKAKLLHFIYLIGLIILLIRGIIGIIKLKLLKGEYKTTRVNDKRLIIAGNNYQPFSFMGLIIIPREVWESDYRDGIIQHEVAHINQRHSIDILLNELILLFQWFNPFAWLNKRFIQENRF